MTMETDPLRRGAEWISYEPDALNLDHPIDLYEHAAWLVEDAMQGNAVMDYTGFTKRQRRSHLNRVWVEKMFYYPAVFALIVLSFLEIPLWCDNGSWYTWTDPTVLCAAPDSSLVYLSTLPYLPKGLAFVIEAVLILIVAISVLRKLIGDKDEGRQTSNVTQIQAGIVGLMVADFAIFVLLNQMINLDLSVRLAGFLRAGLFFTVPSMVKALINVWHMISEFANVALLLLGTVVFSAWVAAMALDDVDKPNPAGGPTNEGFESLLDSLYTMFEASTTQNFPGQAIPTMLGYRWSFFFFIFFMVITVMLFLNLVLAVVYNAYQGSMQSQHQDFFKNRAAGLAQAFRLLSRGRKSVLEGDFGRLIKCMNQSPVLPTITPEDFRFYWESLDDDGSGDLQASELYDLCSILQFEFKSVSTKGFLSNPSRELQSFVRGDGEGMKLDNVINNILLFNSVLIVFESLQDLGNFETPVSDSMWAGIEFLFSLVYVAEVILRLSVVSFSDYWDSNGNRFDFFTTIIMFVAGVLWADPTVEVSDVIMRYFTILRLLRLLRLLAANDRFSFICSCTWRMMLASKEALGLLFGTMFVYSYLGVVLFGGLVYAGNKDLDDTDYRDSNFDVLNFNDLGLGMMSLFVNLCTAFVPEFYEAYTAIYPRPFVAVVFWVSFYVVGVLVAFNIFGAFIIDIFISQIENKDNSIVEEELQSLRTTADGVKIKATFKGSDDIYKQMFMDDAA